MNTLPTDSVRPRAITMWDFSWLERRWPGAGYEDWDLALDELVERGYNAVRIDAYPHLACKDPEATYELIPVWSVHSWGAPMRCEVQVFPALLEFMAKCRDRDIKVGLSSWYRRDTGESWKELFSGSRHAKSWIKTLDLIRDAGLMDAVLYLDLCNEWPLNMWAPFLTGKDHNVAAVQGEAYKPGNGGVNWWDDVSLNWLRDATAQVRDVYPDLPITTSVHPGIPDASPLEFCDLLEPHIWMSGGEFYHRVGYSFQHKFDYSEYEEVAKNAERIYRGDPEYWHGKLHGMIDHMAAEARKVDKPLMTTECWGITDYIDAPRLDWGWVKESCAEGTRHASETGTWCAIATSNFCGPQFHGMWRDIEWHQNMTRMIRSGSIEVSVPEILKNRM